MSPFCFLELFFPETNSLPLKNAWKMSFLLGLPICRGYVSFREGNILNPNNALLYGKSLKFTIYLHCLIPKKMGPLISTRDGMKTPVALQMNHIGESDEFLQPPEQLGHHFLSFQ